ncbi:hypothetical protein JHK82_012557 [Glycine max]|nr:hypothetical protein JHK82_012557 [Glycine max]
MRRFLVDRENIENVNVVQPEAELEPPLNNVEGSEKAGEFVKHHGHVSNDEESKEVCKSSQSVTINIPSNLSPCPWPLQSGDTAIAATSPHFSSKKGKSAAQAIICPSLSTTMKEPND